MGKRFYDAMANRKDDPSKYMIKDCIYAWNDKEAIKIFKHEFVPPPWNKYYFSAWLSKKDCEGRIRRCKR